MATRELEDERCERGSSCTHRAKIAYLDTGHGPNGWRLSCGVHARGVRRMATWARGMRVIDLPELPPEIRTLIQDRILAARTKDLEELRAKRAASEARHAAAVREAWDDYPLRPWAELELDQGWSEATVRTIIVTLRDTHPQGWASQLYIEIQPKGEPSYLELRNIRQLTPAQIAELLELLPVVSGWLEELNER